MHARGCGVLREVSVSIFGSSGVRRLRIGEALLLLLLLLLVILPRIAQGVAPTTAIGLSERAVGSMGKVLCALRYGRHVHGAWKRSPGRRLGGTRVGEL